MSFRLSDEDWGFIYSRVPRLCVDALLIRDGKVLLGRRSVEPYKHQWNLPGGTVYRGETLEQALIRNVKQEVGFDVLSFRPFDVCEFASPHVVSLVFQVDDFSGEVLRGWQTSEIKWFDLSDIPADMVEPQKQLLVSI